jgi:hypothetical protein
VRYTIAAFDNRPQTRRRRRLRDESDHAGESPPVQVAATAAAAAAVAAVLSGVTAHHQPLRLRAFATVVPLRWKRNDGHRTQTQTSRAQATSSLRTLHLSVANTFMLTHLAQIHHHDGLSRGAAVGRV